ncbi:uncharacterized protein LOC115929511 [Strongylocentrotus purpuratus]|uniref:Immunoglobulin domain-containing protein n=1 Tax=Strongylocentrotus purpuratus TaxID=7668 RepID=A0A7M7PRI1_STRPU|nr:uncharacterized protein LOC115929511 [Strongylocentrotus purpuratus]
MALRQSKVVLCIAVYVLLMVLFADNVKSEIIVANAGENITLRCNTTYTSNLYWVKENRDYIATVDEVYPKGVLYDNIPFTQSYETELSSGIFKLFIYDAREESAIYTCQYGHNNLQKYDVRVIGCSTCFVNPSSSHVLEQPKMNVNCLLNNFQTAEQMRQHIRINRNRTSTAIIEGSILTFNISITMMYGKILVEFNPFNDTLSNITCIIPAQLTTQPSYTSDKLSLSTSLITTSATSSLPASTKSSATKSETSPEATSAAITTTGTKPYDATLKSSSSPIMDTSYLPSGTTTSSSTPSITISATSSSRTLTTTTSSPNMDTSYLPSGTTTSNQTRKNINPGTDNNTKNKGITITMIAILGAILIIVVIVIIILVLRLKQRRDRQHCKRNEGEINVAVREQGTCYESIGGSSGIRDGELINNVLYESSDEIIQSSILRSGDEQLDTALYTIPDKTGILKRVAKSGVASVSSHGNSSMNLHQHEQNEFKQEDQYKKVDMPNQGAGYDGDRNIPLYAMPDKGPRSTRNTMNTSPGSVSTEDTPLYALPDKRPGSNGRNIIKAAPGPGTRNEGDEIPLYAVLNKEPGSKDNRPIVKPTPGDQSKALNKDDTHDEEALYADVDKSN